MCKRKEHATEADGMGVLAAGKADGGGGGEDRIFRGGFEANSLLS